MSRKLTTALAAATAAAALVFSLVGCSSASGAASDPTAEAGKTVKVGVVGKSDPQWPAFVEAAKKEGITVELVDFGSYEQPNPALSEASSTSTSSSTSSTSRSTT
jgi:D-methionine transport system substrate-binding protein